MFWTLVSPNPKALDENRIQIRYPVLLVVSGKHYSPPVVQMEVATPRHPLFFSMLRVLGGGSEPLLVTQLIISISIHTVSKYRNTRKNSF